jgi:hypothetical protein
MVKVIAPGSAGGAVIYEGPNNLEEWTPKQPFSTNAARYPPVNESWEYRKGVLQALQMTPIMKALDKFPEKTDFQFEAAWNRNPAFSVLFGLDQETTDKTEQGCMIHIGPKQIALHRLGTRSGGSRYIGQPAVVDILQSFSNGACFNLLVNKETKSVCVFMNGRQVANWTDPEGLAVNGRYIGFQSYSRMAMYLRLSKIRVTEWDGILHDPADVGKAVKDDLIRFVNSDTLPGKLLSSSDKELKLQTTQTTLEIPLVRVREIVMASAKSAKIRRNNNDVRAVFAGAGTLTFQLTRIEQDKIFGAGEACGEFAAPLSAFRQITFNVYKERE